MKNEKLRVFIIFLVFITFTSNAYSQLTEEQIDAFNSVKKIRILKEHLLLSGHSNLSFEIVSTRHFEETAKKLLNHFGIEVVSEDAENYDATLRIQTITIFLEDPFTSSPNNGCVLSGSISLEVPGIPFYKKHFKGFLYTNNMVYDLEYLVKFISAVDVAAIFVPGSFFSTIYEMIGEVFSMDWFNSALKDTEGDSEEALINIIYEAGQMKDSSTVESLIYTLNHENKYVRSMAAWALGEINDQRSIEPLISSLNDKKKEVRKNAVQALVKINYDHPAHLYTDNLSNNKDKYVQFLAKAVLRQMKDNQGLKEIIEELKNKKSSIRVKAVEALESFVDISDTNAVEPLIAALQDEKKDVRAIAAWALGKIEDTRAIDPLIIALKDKEGWVRSNAARALGMIKGNRAVEHLINTLKDKESRVQVSTAWALGELKDNRSIEPLILSMKDASVLGKWYAIEAFYKIGKPAVIPLIAALENNDVEIRRHAVISLGLIRDQSAVESIISLLNDEHVRSDAITSLALINDRRAVEPIITLLTDKNEVVRSKAAKALGKLGDIRAVEHLIYTLKDKESRVQVSAAWALGELKAPSAIEPLIATLNDKYKSIDRGDILVSKEVANSLNEITGKGFGENPLNWKEWWNQNKENFLKDR